MYDNYKEHYIVIFNEETVSGEDFSTIDAAEEYAETHANGRTWEIGVLASKKDKFTYNKEMYNETELRTVNCTRCEHCKDWLTRLEGHKIDKRLCEITKRYGSVALGRYCKLFEDIRKTSNLTEYNGFLVRKYQVEDYRTRKQWEKAGYQLKSDAVGKEMYAQIGAALANSQHRYIYYLPHEVEPFTDEEE